LLQENHTRTTAPATVTVAESVTRVTTGNCAGDRDRRREFAHGFAVLLQQTNTRPTVSVTVIVAEKVTRVTTGNVADTLQS
jgi:hypothetical protein